jgi:hypothetical protein
MGCRVKPGNDSSRDLRESPEPDTDAKRPAQSTGRPLLQYFQDRDLASAFAETGRGVLAAWERSSLFAMSSGSTI